MEPASALGGGGQQDGERQRFNALQYSFFSNLEGGEDALGGVGGIEDDVINPPEEHFPLGGYGEELELQTNMGNQSNFGTSDGLQLDMGTLPTPSVSPPPQMAPSGGRMLSVVELEARMRSQTLNQDTPILAPPPGHDPSQVLQLPPDSLPPPQTSTEQVPLRAPPPGFAPNNTASTPFPVPPPYSHSTLSQPPNPQQQQPLGPYGAPPLPSPQQVPFPGPQIPSINPDMINQVEMLQGLLSGYQQQREMSPQFFPTPGGGVPRPLQANALFEAAMHGSGFPRGGGMVPLTPQAMGNRGGGGPPGWMGLPNAGRVDYGPGGSMDGGGGRGFPGPGQIGLRPLMSPYGRPPQFKCMSQGEINKILSFQAQNCQFGNPYFDDYYCQAFMKKHRAGVNRFAPDNLRQRDPLEKCGKAEVRFADLEGLGKIPFSNLRTPRPLIDFGEDVEQVDEEFGSDTVSAKSKNIKPLHMEQMLHARKVIEDCMCVLLDVDDIDRMLVEDLGKVDLDDLAKRRLELLTGVVSAFRLPNSPGGLRVKGKSHKDAVDANTDGVFLRLVSLMKGRSMFARLLNALVIPFPLDKMYGTNFSELSSQIVWTVLRNIRALFGPTTWISKQGLDVDSNALTQATVNIARCLVQVISSLNTPKEVCNCFEALAKGDLMSTDGGEVTPEDLLLPFMPPDHPPSQPCPFWLEAILVALVQKASKVGLGNRGGGILPGLDVDTSKKWQWAFAVLYGAVTAHLQVLVRVHRVAIERNQPEALAYAKGLLGKDLLTSTLMLCNQDQINQVKGIVGMLKDG